MAKRLFLIALWASVSLGATSCATANNDPPQKVRLTVLHSLEPNATISINGREIYRGPLIEKDDGTGIALETTFEGRGKTIIEIRGTQTIRRSVWIGKRIRYVYADIGRRIRVEATAEPWQIY